MESKYIVGCYFANPMESFETNNLVLQRKLSPFISSVFDFEKFSLAIKKFRKNEGFGKIVVGMLAHSSNQKKSSSYTNTKYDYDSI